MLDFSSEFLSARTRAAHQAIGLGGQERTHRVNGSAMRAMIGVGSLLLRVSIARAPAHVAKNKTQRQRSRGPSTKGGVFPFASQGGGEVGGAFRLASASTGWRTSRGNWWLEARSWSG